MFCLSCSACPVQPVLFSLLCSDCPGNPVLSRQSCSARPVLSVLFRLPWFFFPACPILAILSCLSCHSSHVLPILFCLSFSVCPVLAALSWPYVDAQARNDERKNQGGRKFEREFKERKSSRSAKIQGARMQKRKIEGPLKSASAKSFVREGEDSKKSAYPALALYIIL
jgi:hypothetical protein